MYSIATSADWWSQSHWICYKLLSLQFPQGTAAYSFSGRRHRICWKAQMCLKVMWVMLKRGCCGWHVQYCVILCDSDEFWGQSQTECKLKWREKKTISADLGGGGVQNEIFHFVGPPGPEGRDFFSKKKHFIIFKGLFSSSSRSVDSVVKKNLPPTLSSGLFELHTGPLLPDWRSAASGLSTWDLWKFHGPSGNWCISRCILADTLDRYHTQHLGVAAMLTWWTMSPRWATNRKIYIFFPCTYV